MKTADGYPVVCYGAKGKYGIHSICRRCAIYRKYDSIPEKPCYRLMEYTCRAEKNARSLNPKIFRLEFYHLPDIREIIQN